MLEIGQTWAQNDRGSKVNPEVTFEWGDNAILPEKMDGEVERTTRSIRRQSKSEKKVKPCSVTR